MNGQLGNGSGVVVDDMPPVYLSKTQRRIWDAVRKSAGGIAIYDLVDVVYGGLRNGGPLTADETIRVHICAMNKRLKAAGLTISGRGNPFIAQGSYSGYGIYRIPAEVREPADQGEDFAR